MYQLSYYIHFKHTHQFLPFLLICGFICKLCKQLGQKFFIFLQKQSVLHLLYQ